jgi:hypothetical protein
MCKDSVQYNETLETKIGLIATDIISDSALSKEIDRNSKIFFLSNRLKDTLNRKSLMDKTAPAERTEKMREFLEQVDNEALYYAEEIFTALLKEFDIVPQMKAPVKMVEKKKPSVIKKVRSSIAELNQPSLVLHLNIVFFMVLFIAWFHLSAV